MQCRHFTVLPAKFWIITGPVDVCRCDQMSLNKRWRTRFLFCVFVCRSVFVHNKHCLFYLCSVLSNWCQSKKNTSLSQRSARTPKLLVRIIHRRLHVQFLAKKEFLHVDCIFITFLGQFQCKLIVLWWWPRQKHKLKLVLPTKGCDLEGQTPHPNQNVILLDPNWCKPKVAEPQWMFQLKKYKLLSVII